MRISYEKFQTKILRREQDRSGAHKRKEIEQLRLEFVGREERMQLDGDRAELQRIKNELRALNLVPTKSDALFSEPGLTHPKQFLPFDGPSTVKPSSNCEDEERDGLLSTCFYDSVLGL